MRDEAGGTKNPLDVGTRDTTRRNGGCRCIALVERTLIIIR